jgi:hypothetical protein
MIFEIKLGDIMINYFGIFDKNIFIAGLLILIL